VYKFLQGFFIAATVAFSTPTLAASDAQLWTSAGVRVRPTKRVKLMFEQQLRLDQNLSRVDKINTDVGVSYKATKWLAVGGGYRFSMRTGETNALGPTQRVHVQGQASGELGPVGLSYRLRFQDSFAWKKGALNLKHTLRNRVGLKVDTNTMVTPGFSTELFTRLAERQEELLKKLRMTLGVAFKPDKKHVVDVFYRIHLPLADPENPLEHIVGLGYQYRLPRKKKK
jgi:hypothetical protein